MWPLSGWLMKRSFRCSHFQGCHLMECSWLYFHLKIKPQTSLGKGPSLCSFWSLHVRLLWKSKILQIHVDSVHLYTNTALFGIALRYLCRWRLNSCDMSNAVLVFCTFTCMSETKLPDTFIVTSIRESGSKLPALIYIFMYESYLFLPPFPIRRKTAISDLSSDEMNIHVL